MSESRKTALYNMHQKYGGKVVDYAGWALSVQFEGLNPEHENVRTKVGLFDVSHMGEVEIKGNQATECVQYLITNDVEAIVDGQIVYTFMCNENGGVVDDLLAYRYSKDHYLLVINASNIEKDVKWILENTKQFDVEIKNISDDVSQVAIQGPLAQKVLQKVTDTNLDEIEFFHLKRDVNVAGAKCLVSRTGYTGEDGFEIYFDNKDAETIWEALMENGKEEGIKPIGLGARDTLRFEATLPLYGNELSADITPLEAGYGMFVKLKKESDFIGKAALAKQKEEGLKRKIVGFELIGRGIPRHGYEVEVDGKKIGVVTTGYAAPTVKKNIGNALVDIEYTELGTEFDVVIRNKPVKAKVISKRFLSKK
ncbi:aminomethyltransferase GcvT [Gottschalkia purinilytica]|uniref:Aminomethyltransferase n=1 Tax=Gottschalkia purinilytica TaxID=1503 RepID=A0A0L0W7N6_GOTPU|nr:glycine cleavage system aminomethyltransferase GcvT [Gottschalkia purinilytica]KNF07544.1 aminomethyltransferase GcvT [Gottschalkia purinilytica]